MSGQNISRVAIVGAGTMGKKIAYRCAVSGLEVRVYDKYPEALQSFVNQVDEWFAERVEHGVLTADQVQAAKDQIKIFSSMAACLEDTDLVIETVPEILDLKREVLAEMDGLLPEKAFVCTNSSSMPCSWMADALSRPERFFNINFSMPEKPEDKLVEVMRGARTAPEALIAADSFIRSMDMVPIVTYREIMGFSFNRVWRAIKREVLHLVDQGYSDYQDIDRAWIMEFGTSFGPFGLLDIVGLDVVRDIEAQYYADSGEARDKPPKMLEDMIAQGKLGLKSGQGFYQYPDPAYKETAWLHKSGPYHEDISKKLSDAKE
jgi:3-hydroxybutyryl-CoA dehydrogenase